MADYPTLPQSTGSTETWHDPLLASYSRSGVFRGRRLQAAKNKGFVVEHKFLTAAQKATLETFYDTYRSAPFNFWWADAPGTVFTNVYFAEESALSWRRNQSLLWDVTVKLERGA